MESEINYAKVKDIKIGQRIGSMMNGNVLFPGKVVEITYQGISSVNGKPFIGGYQSWGDGNSRISFSMNDENHHIVLL